MGEHDLDLLLKDWEMYGTTKDVDRLERCREAGWIQPSDPPDGWDFDESEQEYFALTKSGQIELERIRPDNTSGDSDG